MFVNDDRVDVIGNKAESAGAQLRNFSARVSLDDNPVINLHSKVSADGEALRYFLTETPVDEYLEGEARSWKLAGEASGGLKLELPLDQMDEFKFSIEARVKEFLFAIPESDIKAEHLTGRISFSTEDGLNSQPLFGSFLGRPAEFSIQTMMNGSRLMFTDINWNSRVTIPRLQHWLELDWLSLLEGEAAYRARLRLTNDAIDLTVNSDLEGMEIELPAPLAKDEESRLPLNLRLSGKKEGTTGYEVTASLGEIGQASIDLTSDFLMSSAAVALGKNTKLMEKELDQIIVTGYLPELNVELWQNRFAGQPGRADEVQVAQRLNIKEVQIGKVHYGDYQWSDMEVSFTTDQNAMKLVANSKELAGYLWIPLQEGQPYHLNMERLHLSDTSKEREDESTDHDVLSEINPALLPDIDVAIKSLVIGDQDSGAVSFKLQQSDSGVKIDNITTLLAGMNITGFADWVKDNKEQHSWFQGRLEGGNLGDLNKALGFPELLESEKSRLDINLNWEGSPLRRDFASMKGGIDIRLDKGRIIDSGSGAGALRLFGVLNVDTLRRRMFLDFSDLYSSGISFDQLTGVVRFNQGKISFDEPVVIEGPSSTIRINGQVDANKEELNLTMTVTLPVTSNLPILSVLLGTAPQLSGVIFIADKLVGDQVNELASIHYTIKGSFDEPVMALDEEFSRRTRKRSSSSNK